MRASEINKTLRCCTLLIALLLCGEVYSKNVEDMIIDELIGKSDPFAIVTAPKPRRRVKSPPLSQKQAVPVTEEDPELNMASVMLKFLRAENLETTVSNLLTSYGAISTDPDTNTIIICDTKENVQRIVSEIRKADQTPKQVLIEVVIMDVQLNDDTEIGVNWDKLLSGSTVNYTQSLSDLASGGTLNILNGQINAAVKALQKVRDTEILSNPKVLVVSGQTAFIETVEEIPYTELTETDSGGGGASAISSTEFKNAGITLTVSAIITDDGKILLAIEPDQSINTGVAGVGSTDVPIVDRRRVSTKLLMEDGQVVVIGGLRSKEVRINRDKVPLFGDLPLVGQ
ncbi:MAG: type II secretion system protein GspD, partial [Planctomycetes bacterium]|nr:type II secretion system protein GspD [Planctomycetota bacterium]